MKYQQQNHMRKIAESHLKTIFGTSLSSEVENELATALVRQWTTYEGYAGLLTDKVRFWLQIKKNARGYEMTRSENPGCALDPFVQSWGIDPADVPSLLHRLNVSQSVELETLHGTRMRLRMKPKERTIAAEGLPLSS